MARVCSVCAKGPVTGNNVSHANNRTKRRWYPNLQTVRVLVDGAPKRVRGSGWFEKRGPEGPLFVCGSVGGSSRSAGHSARSSIRATSAPSPGRWPSVRMRV